MIINLAQSSFFVPIAFTINSEPYSARQGMSWYAWAQNIQEINCESRDSLVTIGEQVVALDGVALKGSDKLVAYQEYNGVSPIGNITYDGNGGEFDISAGLFDANDNLVASWDTLVNTYGMDIEKDYTYSSYKKEQSSPYYILTNYTALSKGTKLIIDDSVTKIGSTAFFTTSKLTNVIIPTSVISIGDSAFESCTSLNSVTIPSSVTSIGASAFSSCSGLETVYHEHTTAPTWGSYVFYSTQNRNITFYFRNSTVADTLYNTYYSFSSGTFSTNYNWTAPESGDNTPAISSTNVVKYLNGIISEGDYFEPTREGYEFAGWYKDAACTEGKEFNTNAVFNVITVYAKWEISPGLYDTNNTLVASWDTLVNTYGMDIEKNYTSSTYTTDTASPYYVLKNNSALSTGTKLIISRDVERIGNYTFRLVETINSVVIPKSVTSIGDSAFYSCSNLVDVNIPESVTSIGAEAFRSCTALESIIIPDSITVISSRLFRDCSSLKSVTIPSSIVSIELQAFYQCYALSQVVIPKTCTSIGDYAFYYNNKLAAVYFEQTTPPVWGRQIFERHEYNTEGCVATTYYFRNSVVRDSFNIPHSSGFLPYNGSFSTLSTDYSWTAP